MAAAAGVQVNVVTQAYAPDLHAIAADTGGRFETYDAAGPGVGAALDEIRAAPPRAVVTGADRPVDAPDVPLIGGIVVSVLLCISLAVLRR